jgi:hypothetical protein
MALRRRAKVERVILRIAVRPDHFNTPVAGGNVVPNLLRALPWNRSTIALAVALAASPALAAQDYPPGLFENSPVVPSGPPDATNPSGAPEAEVPFGPPNAGGPRDDYCAGVGSRTFRSLAEVRRAHARCDPGDGVAPLSPPPDE